MDNNELIKDCVYNSPLALLVIKDQSLLNLANKYLPYSTGFEIECDKGENFNIENFKSIPDILDISIDSYEQRFRIPNGVKGLICLYNICQQLVINSRLNLGSGIHYHIDMSNCFSLISDKFIEENNNWILEELDSWNYQGTYNRRECSKHRTWVRYASEHKTLEIRIGEMSFDYKTLVSRIIHGNSIVKKIKEKLDINTIEFSNIDKSKIIDYLKQQKYPTEYKLSQINDKLKQLNEEIKGLYKDESRDSDLDRIRSIIKNRTKFL